MARMTREEQQAKRQEQIAQGIVTPPTQAQAGAAKPIQSKPMQPYSPSEELRKQHPALPASQRAGNRNIIVNPDGTYDVERINADGSTSTLRGISSEELSATTRRPSGAVMTPRIYDFLTQEERTTQQQREAEIQQIGATEPISQEEKLKLESKEQISAFAGAGGGIKAATIGAVIGGAAAAGTTLLTGGVAAPAAPYEIAGAAALATAAAGWYHSHSSKAKAAKKYSINLAAVDSADSQTNIMKLMNNANGGDNFMNVVQSYEIEKSILRATNAFLKEKITESTDAYVGQAGQEYAASEQFFKIWSTAGTHDLARLDAEMTAAIRFPNQAKIKAITPIVPTTEIAEPVGFFD